MKRIYRLYRAEGLMVGRTKRKRIRRDRPAGRLLSARNQQWSLDFVSDALAGGGALRALTVVDGFTRECPAIRVGTSLSSHEVTRALKDVMGERGKPESLRCDNGPEFTSRHFLAWCEEQGIVVKHIQPGKPMQNGHVESFNGRFRDECLNANRFLNLADARTKIERRRREYNEERPHSALDYRTPSEFALAGERLPFPANDSVMQRGHPSALRETLTWIAGNGRLGLASKGGGCRLPLVGTEHYGRMNSELSKLRLVEKKGAGHMRDFIASGRRRIWR